MYFAEKQAIFLLNIMLFMVTKDIYNIKSKTTRMNSSGFTF